jgi:hypothetical protein
MNDVYTYQIRLRGQLDEGEINAGSPLHMTVVQADGTTTLSAVHTDQSGLVGLLRHLHGRGFDLLSVSRTEPDRFGVIVGDGQQQIETDKWM